MEVPDVDVNVQANNLITPGYQGAAGIPGTLLRTVRKPAVFKKRQPFYHLLDSTNIVEIKEEWLYNYPDFFKDNSILLSGSDVNSLMMTT